MTEPQDHTQAVNWLPVPGAEPMEVAVLPFQTHRGEIEIEGVKVKLFKMSDGTIQNDYFDFQKVIERMKFPS